MSQGIRTKCEINSPARRSDWLGQLISSQSQIQDSTGRILEKIGFFFQNEKGKLNRNTPTHNI